jgi:hypothetical protein
MIHHTVSKQKFDKHVSVAMDTKATIEERCFLCGLCRDVQDIVSNELVVGELSAVQWSEVK